MHKNKSHTAFPEWLPLTKQLVDKIAEFAHQAAALIDQGEFNEELEDDLNKLRQSAIKLDAFRQTILTNKQWDDHRTWHDLRNLIGIIIGYCEIILEELSPEDTDKTLPEHLTTTLTLCNHILSTDDNDNHPPAIANINIKKATTGTILIVDDQPESRDLLSRHLKQHNHKVIQAGDGNEMFEKLNDEKNIDLILLDLILPEMDGDQLLQQLKEDEHLRAIPVIVVSGNKDTQRVIRCIEAGAEDYLFKPFNTVLLQARISAGIERKNWHDKEQLYRQELERNQRFIRNVFGRYLSEEIVSTLLENPDGLDLGGVQRKVSVLMADIRGFTTIAEQLPPQRVVGLLNIYLGTMSEIIMKYNGTVDEFIGDAILAIFGAPISRTDDSDRALQCAIEMQASIDDINRQNREQNLPEIEMGISINTGLVVAGNIGSKKRAKYGVVGHTVNQTARIEEHCGAGSILISEATLNDSSLMLSIGESKTINAKGILQAIKIFELTAIKPEANQENITA